MATTTCPVACACHDGPYTACSEPGGCGSAGCGREQQGSCPACWRRDPNYGLVCDPCRDWLPFALSSIATKYADLPDVLVPGDRTDQKVTGSRDPAAPLNLDAEDLLTRVTRLGGIPVDSTRDTMVPADALVPATVGAAWFEVTEHRHEADDGTVSILRDHRHVREQLHVWQRQLLIDGDGRTLLRPARDQVGYLPVAQVLDAWARHWVIARSMREIRPVPTVPILVDWLSNRLDWACDRYEPIGDFAASLRTVRGNIMAVLGEFDAPPAPCDGVQCKRCDKKTLVHTQDGSDDILCTNQDCLKIYRRSEYVDWVKHLDGYERSARDPQEVRELLRRRSPADAA